MIPVAVDRSWGKHDFRSAAIAGELTYVRCMGLTAASAPASPHQSMCLFAVLVSVWQAAARIRLVGAR